MALVRRMETPRFSIDCTSPTVVRQFRYAILLSSENPLGSMLLVNRFNWIEVYFTGLPENCFQLRKIILEAISTCAGILAYNDEMINVKVTVPCQQEHQISGYKLHPAIVSMEKDHLVVRCSIENHLPTIPLSNERQTCWLIGEFYHYILYDIHVIVLKKILTL